MMDCAQIAPEIHTVLMESSAFLDQTTVSIARWTSSNAWNAKSDMDWNQGSANHAVTPHGTTTEQSHAQNVIFQMIARHAIQQTGAAICARQVMDSTQKTTPALNVSTMPGVMEQHSVYSVTCHQTVLRVHLKVERVTCAKQDLDYTQETTLVSNVQGTHGAMERQNVSTDQSNVMSLMKQMANAIDATKGLSFLAMSVTDASQMNTATMELNAK